MLALAHLQAARHITPLFAATVATGLMLSAVSTAPPACGQPLIVEDVDALDPVAEAFREIPGVKELSGQLIVRPHRVDDLVDGGMAQRQAETMWVRARQRVAPHVIEDRTITGELIIHVPHGFTDEQFARDLIATGEYEYVEPNSIVYPVECPNDSRFDDQWQHVNMESCAGWDIETGDPSIVIGVCDTGVRTTHEDLAANRLLGYNAVDRQREENGGRVNDINGHGTATTGCAAAIGNNGVGVAGTSWNISHRMIRVSNSSGGSAYMSDLTHGALWAAQNGSKVASVSYSGVANLSTEATGEVMMNDYGAVLVWAAGNDGTRLRSEQHDHVLVVGATDSGDRKTSWSNYGPIVDVTAPGAGVYTTLNNSNSSYGGVSGTSFSCPLTAGLAALLFSKDPNMSPYHVVDAIKWGSDDLGDLYPDEIFGYGRINVLGAVQLVDHIFLDVRPRGEQFNSGDRMGMAAYLADPNEPTGLFYSTSGTGSTFIQSLGVSVDLDNAKQIGKLKTAREDGIVNWSFRIPPLQSPIDVWFQMAQASGRTSIVVQQRLEP